ncbi:MAG: Ig-like domain-containing protein, partial [Deltaproteobacteria bacterium]|nr:Ig-like domain-containing protein [Deltaproteobacteria bacterium]
MQKRGAQFLFIWFLIIIAVGISGQICRADVESVFGLRETHSTPDPSVLEPLLGQWFFVYEMGGERQSRVYMLEEIIESTVTEGEYIVTGRDDDNNMVIASYDDYYGDYTLLEEGADKHIFYSFIIDCGYVTGSLKFVDSDNGSVIGSSVYFFGWGSENRYPVVDAAHIPLDGAENVPVDLTLQWGGSDPDNESLTYCFYFGKLPDPTLIQMGLTFSTLHYPQQLDYDTTYYWAVAVKDVCGNTTYGSVWSFTTEEEPDTNRPPYVPVNPVPFDKAVDIPLQVQLMWTGGDPDGDQVSYDLYVGTGTTPPLVQSGLQVTAFNYGAQLACATRYNWKVVARDSGGKATAGPVWSFTTEA